jgi:hypothetical protein|nr:hypothetical protein [Neorhizobium tomejilense]
MPACIPSASTAYFLSIAETIRARSDFPGEKLLTDEFVGMIETLRDEVRAAEGGGGMCHVMSEILMDRYGWPMLSVAYLSADGGMICSSHIVNILPDGSVLDTTRDQFGEGFSVSYVAAGSDEIGRYRPEFYEDFHPGHPDDADGVMSAWLDAYHGHSDCVEQDRVTSERGHAWWLTNTAALDAYEAAQAAYGEITPPPSAGLRP